MPNITTPARLPHVFCIGAASGKGHSYWNNPTHTLDKEKFSVLGEGVRGFHGLMSDIPGSERFYSGERVSGTSYATPIAAGIAALFLQMMDLPARSCDEYFADMRKMFLATSQDSQDDNYLFLKPWILVPTSIRIQMKERIADFRDKIAGIRNRPASSSISYSS
jgi:hypothetical protein